MWRKTATWWCKQALNGGSKNKFMKIVAITLNWDVRMRLIDFCNQAFVSFSFLAPCVLLSLLPGKKERENEFTGQDIYLILSCPV